MKSSPNMRHLFPTLALIVGLTGLPAATLAATNCDSQAKPAFDCPTGYSIMCVPVGGDHWGCGKQNADGTITESAPSASPGTLSAQPVADPAPRPTSTAVAQTSAPTATQTPAPAPAPSSTSPATTALATTPTQPPAVVKPTVTSGPASSGEPAMPINDVNRDKTSSPQQQGVALEDAQGLIEDMTDYVPESLQPVLEAVASTLAVVVALLGFWEWWKRRKEKKTGTCARCGEKRGAPVTCETCDGTGKIEQEYETTVKCPHCKGDGIDPCHDCGGTGKMSMPNAPQSKEELEALPPCDFCGGSGKKRVGAGHDWGEANEAMKGGFACCMCHGKKEQDVTLKREATCPDCDGKGKKE